MLHHTKYLCCSITITDRKNIYVVKVNEFSDINHKLNRNENNTPIESSYTIPHQKSSNKIYICFVILRIIRQNLCYKIKSKFCYISMSRMYI
jgi:hypothetical protein